MILNEFPDLGWLKKQISDRFASGKGWGGRALQARGWPTVILHTEARTVNRENIIGPLSLFTNLRGTSHVRVDGHTAKVTPDYFYLSNAGQSYTLQIEPDRAPVSAPTETFNIHFGEHFGDEVRSSLGKKAEFLLENQFQKPNPPPSFYNRLYPRDTIVNRIIQSIRSRNNPDAIFEEEQLYRLLTYLFQQNESVNRSSQLIPAIKSATRDEILKRLFVATDYIYTYYHKDLSLDDLAQVACLSKFHFLRLFQAVFQITPHQFITGVRIARAKDLLRQPHIEIHEVARKVGFRNSSSFSRLFYKRIGCYPTQYVQSSMSKDNGLRRWTLDLEP